MKYELFKLIIGSNFFGVPEMMIVIEPMITANGPWVRPSVRDVDGELSERLPEI